MASLRGSSGKYSLGNQPPQLAWTVVRGDTASFRVYVADDAKVPIQVADWEILMHVKRPTLDKDKGVITDNATLILELIPSADIDDAPGEFTVSLTSQESTILQTGDIFDIQLTDPGRVWTVCQGQMIILEDVTD